MDNFLQKRAVEVDEIFRKALPIIRSALVGYYRLSEDEAAEAEKDLDVWFARLARRGGSGQMPVKALRISLLSAACQYGHSFQLWKVGGAPTRDVTMNAVLTREPLDVASELATRFDEEF